MQLDGAGTNADDRVLIVGATNRPQEIEDVSFKLISYNCELLFFKHS